MWQNHPFLKLLTSVILLALVLGGLLNTYSPAQAATTLTITPITWNIIGLDSNNPATGPRFFPVAARVCSIGGPSDGPVTVNFVWGDANTTYINLRTPITSINVGTLATGGCADAYFEVAVNPVMAAFDQSRPYTITATDADETVPTPQPRELYVEHLISQNRNATTNIRYGTTLANLTSVAAGGAMNLVVGGNYYIELTGGTATQGYE
ncbi:MAG: hypothetical protein HY862_21620 [Chloroflexi bacterium]|nr:hypothetical protein [Chloroflexota bacterium]